LCYAGWGLSRSCHAWLDAAEPPAGSKPAAGFQPQEVLTYDLAVGMDSRDTLGTL